MQQENKENFILGCDKIVNKGPIPPKSVTWDEFKELCEEIDTMENKDYCDYNTSAFYKKNNLKL